MSEGACDRGESCANEVPVEAGVVSGVVVGIPADHIEGVQGTIAHAKLHCDAVIYEAALIAQASPSTHSAADTLRQHKLAITHLMEFIHEHPGAALIV